MNFDQKKNLIKKLNKSNSTTFYFKDISYYTFYTNTLLSHRDFKRNKFYEHFAQKSHFHINLFIRLDSLSQDLITFKLNRTKNPSKSISSLFDS